MRCSGFLSGAACWPKSLLLLQEPMQTIAPIVKDLVLLGGGHAHVAVLKSFGMAPIEGVRVTLINRETDTPYSGMLPGLIAGHYGFDEAHIDLGRLARFSAARFIHDEVIGLEPGQNRLLFADRPPVSYDILSIDTGSAPNSAAIPGAREYSVPVKPISNFLDRWNALCERALASNTPLRLAVAGAGAGGVEMLLAAQYRLRALRQAAGIDAPVMIDLFSGSADLLPSFNPKVRAAFKHVLHDRSIRVHAGSKVVDISRNLLTLDNGEHHEADEILLVTDAAAPAWLAQNGLATDVGGFVRVNECLQSVSHNNIFAAGDVASVDNHPRPKAGVFAVRQGPPLIRNLVNSLTGKSLVPFIPQKSFLSLISTGDKFAIAAKQGMSLKGQWVWRWKDWIDRRFMAKFNDLPAMQPGQIRKAVDRLPANLHLPSTDMRCGGCGAKVGADILSEALRGLQPVDHDDVIAGLAAPDDAAIVRVPAGKVAVHTVDSFRAMIEDPYVFGKIAANHALSDIFAMGGEPRTALAIATLPYSAPAITGNDLHQMMAGAVAVLNAAGATLVGGHTAEGAELTLGFAVNGVIDEAKVLRKNGLQPGDAIILTKALGTGALFAADMQYRARSRWISAAIEPMLQSNSVAAKTILESGASACTDITGFGLAGHLGELAEASNVTISLDPSALPVLDGTNEVIAAGMVSSLQQQNVINGARFFGGDTGAASGHPVLFDPQTSGGLAAGIPARGAKQCIEALHDRGYGQACIIGTVSERVPEGPYLSLRQ